MAASDFFSRWAKRPASDAAQATPDLRGEAGAAGLAGDSPEGTAPDAPAPTPTLERARELTPADDFRPFVRTDVDPQVRNAAMRQLFTDPHFNVMDGLDIYIDDYHTPNPLPVGDIQRMAGASLLRLIQSEPSVAPAPDRVAPPGPAVPPERPLPPPSETASDHPDLRLQPNPDPGSADPEPGPG